MSIAISPTQTSARQMLRAATADLHARVDARFAGSVMGTFAEYRAFLCSMATVILPLERALERAAIDTVMPDWSERRRAAHLLEDLETLGVSALRETDAPAVGSEARQLGMVYVLEGSRLGGKLLLRRALAHGDSQIRTATRYLSHGAGHDFWGSFLVRLEGSAAVARAPHEAVAGARAVFTQFGDAAA